MAAEQKKQFFSGIATVKNIGIAVLTTVLGSTAVYLLGFQRSASKEAFELKKTATSEAWHSVTDYLRYSDEKNKTIGCFSCDPLEMKVEMIRAFDQNINSLRNLQKNVQVDEKMQTIIDRNIEQFDAQKPLYTLFYDSMSAIAQHLEQERQPLYTSLQQYFLNSRTRILTRDTTEIKSILKDLDKKYDLNLQLNDAIPDPEIDYTALPGKWKIECSFILELNKDGSASFINGTSTVNGSWSRKENNLSVIMNDGDNLNLEIGELNKKMFVFFDKDTRRILGACPM